MVKYVNLSLDEPTRERIKAVGKKGETYIQVINRILDENENMKKEH